MTSVVVHAHRNKMAAIQQKIHEVVGTMVEIESVVQQI